MKRWNKTHMTAIVLWLLFGLGTMCDRSTGAETAASPERSAREIVKSSGVRGGVIVHFDCGDGQLTAALRVNDSYLVQGLDRDPDVVATARQHVRSLGIYGPVSVDRWSGEHLPYVDSSINLVVAGAGGETRNTGSNAGVAKSEILRVLAPGGVAVSLDSQLSIVNSFRKPIPAEIDEWTHYLHDASNNAVADDEVVGPPRRLQWVAGPRYSRHHDRMSSLSAAVSAGGRVFYIYDEATPISILISPKWSLIARDAFNGAILWRRPISEWQTHLWPLKSGPAQLPRRLVTDGNRVYVTLGIDSPLSSLDAATGETIRTYNETEGTEEVIFSDGVLFALVNDASEKADRDGRSRASRAYGAKFWDEAPRKIYAIGAQDGEVLWTVGRRVLPGTLAADAQRVVFHDGDCVVCLDRTTGKEVWRSEAISRAKEIRSFFVPALVLYEDVVLFSGGETAGLQTGSWYESGEDTLTALSAKNGKTLWKAYHPPSGYRSPEDVLVANGLVWSGETTSGRAVGVFSGRDPHTGEVKSEFSPDVDTYWFHHRCYRGKATNNYLLMSRAGIEFLDLQKQHWDANHWVRGACLYGVMPANGLVYAPQHPCACYLEAKQSGFNALAAEKSRIRRPESGREERLERGPAFGQTGNRPSATANLSDWPTYRHDSARSGCTKSSIPASLVPAWRTEIGGRLSAVTVAEGKLFVASVDTHTVFALDAESGERIWQYTAGGRVDSPPTIHSGLALFGCADGYVYALRASDGVLAWRFRAAPIDERLVSFEQIESVWPVHGSVLVRDDVLYCVSGRSMFLDGGLCLWRLDPTTGRVLSETVLDGQTQEQPEKLQDYVSWLNMPTALPDILSSDDEFVYMRSQPFTLEGKRLPLQPMPRGPDADRGAPEPVQNTEYAHLFSPTGFLDDSGWHRTYWMYGSMFVSGWSGYYLSGKAVPAGRLLVFDDNRVYGFGRKPKYYRWTTPIEHQLFATSRTLPRLVQSDGDAAQASGIRIAKSKSLNIANKAVSVAAWVNPLSPDGVIIARGGGVHGYSLYVKQGRLCFAERCKNKLVVVRSKEKITGRWTHVAGVLTPDKQLQLYLDGRLVDEIQVDDLIPADPAEAMEIGVDEQTLVGDYDESSPFDGMIDEVRVYSRALTSIEISQLAEAADSAKTPESGLVLSYSFDSGNAKDASGNDNNGTVTGGKFVQGKFGRSLRFVGRPASVPGYIVKHDWTEDLPLFARALVLAGDTIFVAGPPDLIDEDQAFKQINDAEVQSQIADQAAAFEGRKGAQLITVSAAEGRRLSQVKLDSPPVFDGMAAAGRRLYLATTDGQVVCLEGKAP